MPNNDNNRSSQTFGVVLETDILNVPAILDALNTIPGVRIRSQRISSGRLRFVELDK